MQSARVARDRLLMSGGRMHGKLSRSVVHTILTGLDGFIGTGLLTKISDRQFSD